MFYITIVPGIIEIFQIAKHKEEQTTLYEGSRWYRGDAQVKEPFVTLFCSMKAFVGHNAVIQNNALDNWRSLSDVATILIGNDEGCAEAAAKRGFRHVTNVAASEYGTPLLSAMFSIAQQEAKTPLVCYINGDILLPVNFAEQLCRVAKRLSRFLVIGERWDADITKPLSFDAAWDTRAIARAAGAVVHSPTGMDYFAFPRGMVDYMPDFHVGRPGWDGWLHWKTRQMGIPVVDASATITIVHQNHSYRHVPHGNGQDWLGSPETAHNYSILDEYPALDPLRNTIFHASHRLLLSGITTRPRFKRFVWHFQLWFPRSLLARGVLKLRNILRNILYLRSV